MDEVRRVLAEMEAEERALLDQRAADVEAAARGGRVTLIVGTLAALIVAAVVATFLTLSLNRQIGTAVAQVQSSSAELQAAAKQQATGSKEQATAMNEITTTISELLATSRQIAESAQRVAQIADQTATRGARGRAHGATRPSESIASIRRRST